VSRALGVLQNGSIPVAEFAPWLQQLLAAFDLAPADFNERTGWKRTNTRVYQLRAGKGPPVGIQVVRQIERAFGVRYAQPITLPAVRFDQAVQAAQNTPAPPPVERARPVIVHTINSDGSATLRLDLTLPAAQSFRVMAILHDAGLLAAVAAELAE